MWCKLKEYSRSTDSIQLNKLKELQETNFKIVGTCISWMANTSLTVIFSRSWHLLINSSKGGQVEGHLSSKNPDL